MERFPDELKILGENARGGSKKQTLVTRLSSGNGGDYARLDQNGTHSIERRRIHQGCQAYLEEMEKALAVHVLRGDLEAIRDRNAKIKGINDIIDTGKRIRLATWRAQLARSGDSEERPAPVRRHHKELESFGRGHATGGESSASRKYRRGGEALSGTD